MDFRNQFHQFAAPISHLPLRFDQELPLPDALRMASEGELTIYYAPFDHVNPSARVVLVGITPGQVQATKAIATARQCLHEGMEQALACERAKVAASFAGPMRANLVQILDHVGLADRLGLKTCADLWGSRSDLVHFTSALRYPVFERGKNYTGSGITRHRLLLDQLDTYFASECEGLPKALFIPLGAAAQQACDRMVVLEKLAEDQVMRGLPHPSGANAERIAYFLGRKAREKLSSKTRPEPIDAGLAQAKKIIGAWAA